MGGKERPAGRLSWIVVITLLVSASTVWSQEEAGLPADEEQIVTGEVIAVWCYVRDGKAGIGRLNAAHQQVCILRGSPIAIEVGDQVYALAAETERSPLKQQLTTLVGHHVTVSGRVADRDGHPCIAVSHVQPLR